MGKIKFTPEKKTEIIEASFYLIYKSGKVGYSQLQDVYGMNRSEIYRWILKYEANGIEAFVSGNRRYSKEFKIHCIEEYLSGIGSVDDIVIRIHYEHFNWIFTSDCLSTTNLICASIYLLLC